MLQFSDLAGTHEKPAKTRWSMDLPSFAYWIARVSGR
jgi:hypothetical protein